MKKKNYIYYAVGVFLALPSCTQEGPGGGLSTESGNRIYFRSFLPSVTETRAGIVSNENLNECNVTALNPDSNRPAVSDGGEIPLYFSDMHFGKDADGRFLPSDESACIWPDAKSRLHFLAYYPSTEYMRTTIDGDKFKLANYSRKSGGTSVIDYRMENFKVASDIADQIDFIAAYSSGTREDSGETGIKLNFRHQLARIDISAWGASDKYDFQIAGVRIGNALTEGNFSFTSLDSSGDASAWIYTEDSQSLVEHIFSTGESVVFLSKEGDSHASADNAASIMGDAGPAMVIPMAERIEAWEGKADPATEAPSYTTDKLYFSVLIRVTNRKDNTIAYPYPNDLDGIPVVYLAVSNDGKVIQRVYEADGVYYMSEGENADIYTPGDSEEVLGFCWAALPVAAKWDAGKIYTYKLNYSNGIGWQDPTDPNPGEPIIERGKIPFEVTVEDWVPAEGHDPNIDVPKH